MAKRKLLDGVKHQGDGTTSDGTTALVLCSIDLSSTGWTPDGLASDNCIIQCMTRLMGWEPSTNTAMSWRAIFAFQKQAGTVSGFSTSPDVLHNVRSTNFASANPNFTVSGSTIIFQVVGVTSHTFKWLGAWEVSLWQQA